MPETGAAGIPVNGRRQLALWLLCAATLMIILDGTIVTVALPSIQRQLGFSAASLSWVMNAYLIAFGSLLLLAGRLGDLIGRKRMFLAGLAAFTAASLLCGLSASPAMLIAARFAQGIGAAMVSAVSLGMIVTLFPGPREQAKAIGAFSFVGAAGASVGLVLGGVLTEAVGWHWIFFVNVPIGLAAMLPAAKVLQTDRGTGLRDGADWLGAFGVTAGLMLGVYALVGTSQYGWGSARTLGGAAVAAALLAAFVARQATARTPLLPLRIFSARALAGANLAQLLVIAAAFGFQVMITLYMQRVLGYGAAASGLGLLPTAAVIGTIALGFSARIAARFGPRAMLLAGLALITAGLALLTQVPVHASYPAQLLPPLLIFGAGGGLSLPALASLGMSGATPSDAGLASGLFNTTQQIGAALGVAVLSTLAAAQTRGTHQAGAAALTAGYHLAFATGAGLAGAAILTAAAVLWPTRRRPALAECC
jgi:EmrB/QacA subfamily drug resistance transporter